MKYCEWSYLLTVGLTLGLTLLSLTCVEGEGEAQFTPLCWLSRICRTCTCHINGLLVRNFCPDPQVLLTSVHIMGGNVQCRTLDMESGLLNSFQAKTLKLQALGIRVLRNNTFHGHPLLEELILRRNIIETIEHGALREVPRLKSLDLMSNRLTHFPLSAIRVLTNLSSLNLAHNRLTNLQAVNPYATEVDWLFSLLPTKKLNSLQSLHLSYNRITRISVNFINLFPKLVELTLHRNRLVCDCEMAWLREFQKCTCMTSYSQPCRLPRNTIGYNLVTFPTERCSTGARIANCTAVRGCAYSSIQPPRTLPSHQRTNPNRKTWTWGSFITSKPDTTTTLRQTTTLKQTTTTLRQMTMTFKVTTPATRAPTTPEVPSAVVYSGTTRASIPCIPVALGLPLLLCYVSLRSHISP